MSVFCLSQHAGYLCCHSGACCTSGWPIAVVRVEAGRVCSDVGRPLDQAILTEAFRAADLLLVHLSDPKALAARLSVIEQPR